MYRTILHSGSQWEIGSRYYWFLVGYVNFEKHNNNTKHYPKSRIEEKKKNHQKLATFCGAYMYVALHELIPRPKSIQSMDQGITLHRSRRFYTILLRCLHGFHALSHHLFFPLIFFSTLLSRISLSEIDVKYPLYLNPERRLIKTTRSWRVVRSAAWQYNLITIATQQHQYRAMHCMQYLARLRFVELIL